MQVLGITPEHEEKSTRTKSVHCKKSHVYISCTEEQMKNLRKELLATGVVVDFRTTSVTVDQHEQGEGQNPTFEGVVSAA